MFVLKRLDDALDHGDRIYGLVAGVGLSNDVAATCWPPAAKVSSGPCGWPIKRRAGAPATST